MDYTIKTMTDKKNVILTDDEKRDKLNVNRKVLYTDNSVYSLRIDAVNISLPKNETKVKTLVYPFYRKDVIKPLENLGLSKDNSKHLRQVKTSNNSLLSKAKLSKSTLGKKQSTGAMPKNIANSLKSKPFETVFDIGIGQDNSDVIETKVICEFCGLEQRKEKVFSCPESLTVTKVISENYDLRLLNISSNVKDEISELLSYSFCCLDYANELENIKLQKWLANNQDTKESKKERQNRKRDYFRKHKTLKGFDSIKIESAITLKEFSILKAKRELKTKLALDILAFNRKLNSKRITRKEKRKVLYCMQKTLDALATL